MSPHALPTRLARKARWLGPLAMVLLLGGCVTEQTGGPPPERKNLAKAAAINTQMGAGYAREGLYGRAIEKLKLAIREREDYAPAHATLALVYSRTGKTDDARAQYRRALALAPNDPDTQNNYGVFLCANGQGREAQRYFQRAVHNRQYSTPEMALTNAGTCLLNLNQPNKARKKFRRALQINPRFPSALEQMARLSYKRGDYARAQALEQRYRKAASAGPGMLLLFARTERALGDDRKARSYEIQLVQQYPYSTEAGQVGDVHNP